MNTRSGPFWCAVLLLVAKRRHASHRTHAISHTRFVYHANNFTMAAISTGKIGMVSLLPRTSCSCDIVKTNFAIENFQFLQFQAQKRWVFCVIFARGSDILESNCTIFRCWIPSQKNSFDVVGCFLVLL